MRYNYDLDDTSVNPRKIITGILITLIEIAIVVLVAFLIVRYGLERMTMSGNGMEPTVKDDDSILINKMSYKLHSVKRNDVVVLRQNGSEHNYYVVQRVIGLPGEKVKITNGEVYIDGKVLDEKYDFPLMKNGGLALDEITLDDDEYFVLGDNRNNSSDSRDPSVGILKRKDLLGRAWVRIYPFDKVGVIRHE